MAAGQPERRSTARADDPELRGRRDEPRAYLLLAASVEGISGRNSVNLLDVSRTGARLTGDALPAVGKDVVLQCGAVDTFGTVIWNDDGQCGLHFDEPISGPELVALRNAAMAVERSGLTPEELQARADWANGVAR